MIVLLQWPRKDTSVTLPISCDRVSYIWTLRQMSEVCITLWGLFVSKGFFRLRSCHVTTVCPNWEPPNLRTDRYLVLGMHTLDTKIQEDRPNDNLSKECIFYCNYIVYCYHPRCWKSYCTESFWTSGVEWGNKHGTPIMPSGEIYYDTARL